jgi:hypothetical protein
MPDLTDDEITARAIEQALRELPEPTLEQAHDEVCAMIRMIANSYGDRHDGSIHPDDMDELIRIRRLEHAARFMRAQDRALEELRAALNAFTDEPGIDWMLLVEAIDKILDHDSGANSQEQANA